ncbi:hypothetical protein KP509_18G086200 [Ceratopteris richardii]|uniref:BHLH domain-containing protein n=1 Tax=Ceratopteris richardii TaxID=49495 RepID=A0A8T2SW86_CERRI|nr:hypothetical protein KP509_18G086200 [Ceratopteris richardii]
MIHSLLASPGAEFLPMVDSNFQVAACPWSFPGHGDFIAYHADAIFPDASLGHMSTSDLQALVHCGLLSCSSVQEGMDETQVYLPCSSTANPTLSTDSATGTSTLGIDHKISTFQTTRQLALKPNHMMLNLTNDSSRSQADGMFTRRRSWQEALSSPSMTNTALYDNYPTVVYSVNDTNASIASLAYPCTLLGNTRHSDEKEPLYPNINMDMIAHMTPTIDSKVHEEIYPKGKFQISSDHVALPTTDSSDQAGNSTTLNGSNRCHHDQGTPVAVNGAALYKAMNSHCNSIVSSEGDGRSDCHQKDSECSRQGSPPTSMTSCRKRAASIVQNPPSSASQSKRAHIQYVKGGASSSISTTSTTTKSSKSSCRNPLGPALNTNGKPRAAQGSANDPQSVAARNRRERINARLKILQELVPNGSKVDLVTMLEKAINYVKYLQLQLRVLSNDDLWQASQDNLSEQVGGTEGRLDAEHSSRQNNVAFSDTSEAHYAYNNRNIMGDTVYNP